MFFARWMQRLTARVYPILLSVCLLTLLSGCTNDENLPMFRYDIPSAVKNLDPQFSTSSADCLVASHLYEGLVVQAPNGEILPGVAERYTVSDDLRTYTFYLRPDAVWSIREDYEWISGPSVVANDFIFSFERLFRDGSPHAWKYAAIQGAQAVENKTAQSLRGMDAPNPQTLVITLSQPDPNFLYYLTQPSAAPCNRTFYEESRGRYGLELQYIYSNGSFTLSSWSEERVSIQKSPLYPSSEEVSAGGVHFYIGRNPAEQFLNGKTDVALLSWEELQQHSAKKTNIIPIEKTVWCLVFNQDDPVWRNALFRQAVATSIDREQLSQALPEGYLASSLFVPNAMQLDGASYRSMTAHTSPLAFEPFRAEQLLWLGLDAASLDRLPSDLNILLPESEKDSPVMQILRTNWQKHLSLYLKFNSQEPDELQSRFQQGDYEMLIMPITPSSNEISTLLNAFTTESSQNYFHYYNPVYDQLIASAKQKINTAEAAKKYAQAETLLLSDATVVPLYFELNYLAVADGVSDLQFSAFGDMISFKYATK